MDLPLNEYSQTNKSLKEIFPGGGFLLQGNIKMFGSIGIALAIYSTAKADKKKEVGALLLAATLTAVFAGITEPLEFTFIFIAPFFILNTRCSRCNNGNNYARFWASW